MSIPVKLWWDNRHQLNLKMLNQLMVEYEQMKRDCNMAAISTSTMTYQDDEATRKHKAIAFETLMDYRIGVLKDLQDKVANQK